MGTIDCILSYCHNNLADNTLTSLLDYFHERKIVVVRCAVALDILHKYPLTHAIIDACYLRDSSFQLIHSDPVYALCHHGTGMFNCCVWEMCAARPSAPWDSSLPRYTRDAVEISKIFLTIAHDKDDAVAASQCNMDDQAVYVLLLAQDPPSWHPAAPEVKAAAIQSKELCAENGTDLARIAIKHFVK